MIYLYKDIKLTNMSYRRRPVSSLRKRDNKFLNSGLHRNDG